MPRYDQARLNLARISVSAERPFLTALHDVAVVAASELRVARVGIWRFLDDGGAIRCHFLHQPGHADVAEGAILHRADFPRYFNALEQRRVVRVNDVMSDPLAAEFRDSYFAPLGITAMLDAPVYQAGRVSAIVCHEHVAAPREWTADEAEFAAAVADAVARLFGESMLAGARDSIGACRRQVEQLRHMSALGRLAAGMAHDFGNVLMVTQGGADLIAGHPVLDADVAEAVKSIAAASARGRRLVEALLRLARPAAVRPAVVDASSVLTKADAMLRVSAGRHVRLVIEAPSGLPRVLIDPDELERAVINLVINARDAMPNGGEIRCRVYERSARRTEDDAAFLTVEVRDTGHGMDEDTMGRIFEPFFTTKGARGTGLGLAVVQHTVVMAGGFVEAESTPKRGTTIRLCLPVIGAPKVTVSP